MCAYPCSFNIFFLVYVFIIINDNANEVVKSEEGNMEGVWNNLNVNLLETDDSSIWIETQATSLC